VNHKRGLAAWLTIHKAFLNGGFGHIAALER
jgi:hypothetical protein